MGMGYHQGQSVSGVCNISLHMKLSVSYETEPPFSVRTDLILQETRMK